MTNVFLKYNPFSVETNILINEKEVNEMSKLASFRFERLQMWLQQLVPMLVEECNDDLQITFKGTQLDYDDLLSVIQDYKSKNSNNDITVKHIASKTTSDRFKDLIDLFQYLQKECPFEDLRDAQIRENFYKAVGSEFEVSVIATMSSGKSTLINAMLGRELMPSKNEACTATIARIKDIDGKENFSAVCKNIDNKEVCKTEDLTIDAMNEFNNNSQVAYIDIEGDIPFVSSKSVELVLLDTPGPNNSRTEEHKNHTYRIIKEKSKPMVLYVLNATQLSTNDDNYLLASVAEAMKVGGKQAKDRFIFAVNKIDTFDTEKGESVEVALNNVREYLANHGIKNPNIYPISAETAKVIRLSDNGSKLSKKQRQTKENYWAFNDYSEMHLSKYAPLSAKSKETLENMITEAKTSDNVYAETLVHTGIPAVEVAINEYLDKYAMPIKVDTAVKTFRKKIEDKKLKANLMDELKNNNQAREELKTRLKYVEKQLNDGKKAKHFKEKIKGLNMKKEADDKVAKIRSKITKVLKPISLSDNNKMSPLEVEQFMTKLIRDVNNLQSDVKTDLEKIVEESVVVNAESILKEYETYIQSLISDNAIDKSSFKASTTVKILANEAPDATELINRYKYSESVKTGEEWVENTNKRWYKPWTWFQEKGHYRGIYENREYVDKQKVYNDFVTPVKGNFDENIENAKSATYSEAEKFKKFFMTEMDKLNNVLKDKVAELQSISESEKSIVWRIKEDEEKVKWLDEFLIKLDNILEI